MHGSAVGTATPKQPKSSGFMDSTGMRWSSHFRTFICDSYTQTRLLSATCNFKQAVWHPTYRVSDLNSAATVQVMGDNLLT